MALALSVLLAWPASHAAAQVTLVVRVSPEPHEGIEASVEDALREQLGGSVRHVDSTLDELALADAPAGAETPTGDRAHTPRPTSREDDVTLPATSGTGTPAPREHSIEILPHALLIGATVLGIGSFVAGGVALDAAQQATALGALRTPQQVDHERALEDQSTLALGIGIALASCGAGLAIAGVVTLAGPEGPRLRVGVTGVGLTVSF